MVAKETGSIHPLLGFQNKSGAGNRVKPSNPHESVVRMLTTSKGSMLLVIVMFSDDSFGGEKVALSCFGLLLVSISFL